MPSTLPGSFSGGVQIVSGNPWSGRIAPYGGVQLRLGYDASGSVYVGVGLGLNSGGITITSGGDQTSGGLSDGMEMRPGDAYFLPRQLVSGQINAILLAVPAAVSGRCRVYWEIF